MSDETSEVPEDDSDPVEIEWQFDALDLRPVERWLAALPALAMETSDGGTVTALARTPRRLTDTYLDTDDWRMKRAGFVVRIRHRGRHQEVTLKDTRPAEGSGLRQRLEVTETLPADGVGALGTEGPVGRRVRAVVGTRPLHEVLQVRTRRRPFALRVGGEDVAELALDDTAIVVGENERPMHLRRVEVEVRAEWMGTLEPIVEQLRASCGLRPAHLSKFEAGLLAVGREIPGSPDLGPTAITPSSTMGELAFAVVRRQLAVVRDKEPGTRLGEDPEELHDMRVATRRLRAALSLFAAVLPARAQALREELGWMGRLLGAVRDLDVQQEGLSEMADASAGWASVAPGAPEHDPLGELSALLDREWKAARADMLRGLDSVRWERLCRGLVAMVLQGPARRSVASRAPALVGLPDLVLARHDAVAKAAKRARRTGEVTDFHRLRIRSKRLRYALEFGSEVYAGQTARYVRELTAVQDELGRMQDSEVASLRLAELAVGEAHLPAATVFVMGGMAERQRRRVRRLLRRLPKHAARVNGREWRELSGLMERRRAEAEEALPPARRALRAVPAPAPAPPESAALSAPERGTNSSDHPAAQGRGLTALVPPSGQGE
jgi:CHAD domain-containing protein